MIGLILLAYFMVTGLSFRTQSTEMPGKFFEKVREGAVVGLSAIYVWLAVIHALTAGECK